MTLHQMKTLLAIIKYKDGWQFRFLSVGDGSSGYISISSADVEMLPNRKPQTLISQAYLPRNFPAMNQGQFCAWLLSKILELEMHEIGEWFRIHDRPVYDQHAHHDWPSHARNLMRTALAALAAHTDLIRPVVLERKK